MISKTALKYNKVFAQPLFSQLRRGLFFIRVQQRKQKLYTDEEIQMEHT